MLARQFPVPLPAELDATAVRQALASDIPALIIAAWRELAADQVDSGDYLARLTLQDALAYPFAGDPDAVAVVNTAEYAQFIEWGRAGFHLASRWGSRGGQWKISKDGKRYARVPFRIRTPIAAGGGFSTSRARSTMPAAVYAQTRGLRTGDRLGGYGDLYKQSKSYHYFKQIFPGFPAELADVGGYTWKASQFEGMFQAGVRTTPGGGTQSQYVTIRTITPESPGWYIPPTPAHHYAERALDMVSPQIAELLDAAAAHDLAVAVTALTTEVA